MKAHGVYIALKISAILKRLQNDSSESLNFHNFLLLSHILHRRRQGRQQTP